VFPAAHIYSNQCRRFQFAGSAILADIAAAAKTPYVMAVIMVFERMLLLVPWIALLFSAGVFSTVLYRLYFHPLANVPGPRLAAATWLYEIYFDLFLGGKFGFEIGRLHVVYGELCMPSPHLGSRV
jgi:hypothetical protein